MTATLSVEEAATVLGVSKSTVIRNYPSRRPETIQAALRSRQEKVETWRRRLAEIGDKDRYTYEDVGEIFGITRQAVAQWDAQPTTKEEIEELINAEQREVIKGLAVLQAVMEAM